MEANKFILRVDGELKAILDVSQDTAVEEDVREGKTFHKADGTQAVGTGKGETVPNLQEKTATENGDVTPDEGYDGLSKVTVNVENGDGGTSSVIKPLTVTKNGTYEKVTSIQPYVVGPSSVPVASFILKNGNTINLVSTPTIVNSVNDLTDGNSYAEVMGNQIALTSVEELGDGVYAIENGVLLVFTTVASLTEWGTTNVEVNRVYINAQLMSNVEVTFYLPIATDVDGFFPITVDVQPKLQEKTVTENGVITADDEYDGLSEIIVNVQPKLQEKTVTENGVITADDEYDGLSEIIVNVQPKLQEKKVTKNGEYMPDEGYDGFANIIVDYTSPIPSIESEELVIPNGVTGISEGAFSGWSKLKRVTLPFVGGSVKTASDTYQYPFGYIFGTSAYDGGQASSQQYYGSSTSSTTFTTYYIPSSLQSVTITGGEVLRGAFYDCSSLTSISISDSVTSIGAEAFSGCTGLTSITLSDNLTSIGFWAFDRCINLASITIPASVTSIGQLAFNNCSSLASITISDGITKIGNSAFSKCTGLTSITIPNSVTHIDQYAFDGCTNLASITIPASVTSVGTSAFRNCSRLKNVFITNIEAWCRINFYAGANPLDGGTGGNLYLNGDLVTELEIPDSITSIGDYAFTGCKSLINIDLPDSITSIGKRAFSECSNIANITIPSSVTNIGEYAFVTCKITNIIIPDGVKNINKGTFHNCSNLTSITIPNSVTSIGEGAFKVCSSLTTVNYTGTEEQWAAISIGSDNTALTNATINYIDE